MLAIGLPAAILTMPWNIAWAHWLQSKATIGAVGWIVASGALVWGAYRLFRGTVRGSTTGPLEN